MNTPSQQSTAALDSLCRRSKSRRCAAWALRALLGFACIVPAHAAIPTGERQALIDLYNSTNGASWGGHNGWLGAAGTECSWFGVTCDAGATHVIGISLVFNNLTGTLPSLAGLTSLQTFNVLGNAITGSIPALAGMTSLQDFGVGKNQLTGSIPSLAGLANLRSFRVEVNLLSGPIPSLTGLTNLELFAVDSNQLDGPIPSLAGLTSLLALAVDHNQLRGDMPDVPHPNALSPHQSKLCPNGLNPTPNAAWDIAAGTPWYANCFTLPDPVYSSDFDD